MDQPSRAQCGVPRARGAGAAHCQGVRRLACGAQRGRLDEFRCLLGLRRAEDGPVALSDCLAAMAREEGVNGRFFGRLFGPWTTWLKSRSLGDEFEPLRDVVRRHVFDCFSVRRGVLVLGVPSEGKAALNAQKPFPLKGFAKRNSEDLVRRGLAKRQDDGTIVPMGFVTQRMLEAYERERTLFQACKGSGATAPCRLTLTCFGLA